MFQIAIVDDSEEAGNILKGHIAKYSSENDIECNSIYFSNPHQLIDNYKSNYDVIFLDVEMEEMTGFEVASKIRESDKETDIIFVTKMAQLAIRGYEFQALDYMVKPLSYPQFALKFKMALDSADSKKGKDFYIKRGNCISKISLKKVKYIELSGRISVFHCEDGDYETYMALYEVKNLLKGFDFLQCNSYLLVNPAYITSAKGHTVFVGDVSLPISRPRKKDFFAELNNWIAKTNL